jgi:hypothetical protein
MGHGFHHRGHGCGVGLQIVVVRLREPVGFARVRATASMVWPSPVITVTLRRNAAGAAESGNRVPHSRQKRSVSWVTAVRQVPQNFDVMGLMRVILGWCTSQHDAWAIPPGSLRATNVGPR